MQQKAMNDNVKVINLSTVFFRVKNSRGSWTISGPMPNDDILYIMVFLTLFLVQFGLFLSFLGSANGFFGVLFVGFKSRQSRLDMYEVTWL